MRDLILCGLLAGGLTLGAAAGPSVLINEVDYDDASTDDIEFVELINTTGSPVNLGAGNYKLVLINGSGGAEYGRVDLTGTIAANGFYVIAANDPNSTITGANQGGVGSSTGFASVQNGGTGIATPGDFVALVTSTAAPPSGVDTLVDAMSYEGAATVNPIATANGLSIDQTLTPITSVFTNGETTDADSVSRVVGSATGNNANDWVVQARTPGAANGAPSATPIQIAPFRALADGPTLYEITATATTIGNVFVPTQTRLYLQDSSGTDGQSGVLAFNTGLVGDATSIQPGDSVTVTGTKTTFEGETEIVASTVVRNGAGTPPAPLAITPADLTVVNTPNIAGELVIVAGVTSPEASQGALDLGNYGDGDGQWVSDGALVGANPFPISLDAGDLLPPRQFPPSPWDLTGVVIVDDGEIVQDSTGLSAGQGIVAPRGFSDIFPTTAVRLFELYR